MITKSHLIEWLRACDAIYTENKTYLTQLDTAIGDADHGNNMHRGFRKVGEQLGSLADKDIGALLKAVAMTLISTVGGASGPLYGTFFLQAAGKASGLNELNAAQMADVLEAGIGGIKMRGKASAGDKTMLDAFIPALEAFRTTPDDLQTALNHAADAAEKGAEDTIPLIARKGRASYLGERSRGHKDPGATSAALMLRELAKAAEGDA